MTDIEYRALILKMVNGDTLSPEELSKVSEQSKTRLENIALPEWLPPAQSNARYWAFHFPYAWISYLDDFGSLKRQAPETARKLREAAKELNEMCFSSLYIAPDDIAYPMLRGERIGLSEFLLETANLVEESPKDFGYDTIENKTDRKLAFKSFWIRNVKEIVIRYQKEHNAIRRKPNLRIISNEWQGILPQPTNQITPNAVNYDTNSIVATICNTLLAETITANDVAHQ